MRIVVTGVNEDCRVTVAERRVLFEGDISEFKFSVVVSGIWYKIEIEVKNK